MGLVANQNGCSKSEECSGSQKYSESTSKDKWVLGGRDAFSTHMAVWLGTHGEKEEPGLVAWENHSSSFVAFCGCFVCPGLSRLGDMILKEAQSLSAAVTGSPGLGDL